MKTILLGPVFGLAIMATIVGQGGNKKPREWADYKPRTLNELAERQVTKSQTINDNLIIQSDFVPSRVRVVYEETSRQLSRNKKRVISEWARRYAGAPEFYTRPYDTEVVFSEDGHQHWLAIRKEFIPRFEQELKKGDTVDLYLIKLGGIRSDESWEPVLLVEKFSKP